MAQIKYNLGDLGKEKYSTEEQVIGTWIDGKPLYRKVIKLNCPICQRDGTDAMANTDVSSLNIDYVMFKNINIILPSNAITSYDRFDTILKLGAITWYDVANKYIITRHNRVDFNDSSITAIIEYTKTTD